MDANKKFWLRFGASQAVMAGEEIKAIDENNTGTDDVIGTVFSVGGNAGLAFLKGDEKGAKRYLKIAADTIYTYLGLTPLR